MLNPLQAGSTFACDGCGHHASFHILRNEEEEREGGFVQASNSSINGSSVRGFVEAGSSSGRKRAATGQGARTRAITEGRSSRLEESDSEVEELQVVKRRA